MAVIVRIQGNEKIDFTPSTDLLNYEHTYYPQPLTRDISATVHEVPLEDEHFVQFEFDDDTVWFSNSQNVEELFPNSTVRSRDGDKTTAVVTIPFELGRDIIQERGGGLKKVFLKVVRIFKRKESPKKAIMELAADFESQVLGNDPGLYSINDDFSLTKFTAPPVADAQPYLLFLHGSISSTFQSFGKLADSSTWKVIKATYGTKVLGFQHCSVTDGPLKNVLDLVKALPKDCILHIVTQSHGGLVAETLSRFYNSVGGVKGFTPAEMAIFQAANQQEDIATIAQIAAENTNIKIEKYIRVAGPAAGSTLASDRLDRWLNLVSNLVGLIAGPLYPLLRHLIVAAIDAKNDPSVLPGLQALKPNSAFIQAINTGETRIDNALVIISGRSKYFKKRALVILTSLFFREDNDLIVNTASMYSGTPRTKRVQYMMDEGSEVNHFHYFENTNTVLKFEQALLTVPFGDPIPGFTAKEILRARDIAELFATREIATTPLTLDKKHYINAGPGGTFKPSGNSAFDTTPQDVDRIMESLNANATKKIALYFHGGLVGANSGMDTAARITELVRKQNNVYPIAFVWETGLIETLVSNLKEIHQTELFKKLLIKVIKIAAKRLGIEIPDGLGNLQSRGVEKMSEDQIRKELDKPVPFENISVNQGTRSVNSAPDLMILESQVQAEVHLEVNRDRELVDLIVASKGPTDKLNLNDELMDTTSADTKSRGIISTAKIVKALATVIFKTVKRIVQKRDHGFYPTIIEELLREIYVANVGAWFWKQMKDKAAELWHPDNSQIPSNDLSQHAGTYLLRSLNKYGDEKSTDITIDLVGHSAGSIAVAELMDVLADYPRLKIRNIIYMAPAITCKLFNENVLSRKDKFQSFRMFTMSDEYEKKDRLASFIYPQSLLYFISGCLENEGKESDEYILGLQRHFTDQKPYDNVPLLQEIRKFLSSSKDQFVLSVTVDKAGDGLQSLSESHGGFDNDDKGTLKSMLHLLT